MHEKKEGSPEKNYQDFGDSNTANNKYRKLTETLSINEKKSITSYIRIFENRLVGDNKNLRQRLRDVILYPEQVKKSVRVCQDLDRYQLKAAEYLLEMKSCSCIFPKDTKDIPEWIKPAIEDRGDCILLDREKFAECIQKTKIEENYKD